jgi:hypothetical protein
MNQLEPEQAWSISSSAVYGWITGLAAGGLHQVHFALSHAIPDNGFLHVVAILIAAGCAVATLFAGVAALRNHREQRSGAAAGRPPKAFTPAE